MNNRYLYRAKRTDNSEWVEGCLLIIDDSEYRIATSCLQGDVKELLNVCAYEVDQSTICQCTGRKDKNGKLIWDNDIAKQFADCNELGNSLYFFYRIKWNNEYSAFEGYEIYTKETVLFPDLEDIEVIGNIFDNPGLLNE